MRIYALTTLIFLCFNSINLIGQYVETKQLPQKQKLHFDQIEFGIGIDNDHYNTMSLEEIMAFANNPEQMQRDLYGMEEVASTVNRGAAIYVNFGYAPLNKTTNSYRTDREWRFGVGLHCGKEAMLSYKNEDIDTSIVYCNLQSEITLESAYLLKGLWGKRFHWYYGAGMSLGSSFNNQMLLISGRYFGPDEHPSEQESYEKNVETFDAKSVYYARFYIPYGIGYGLNERWIIGFDFKTGIGVQKIQGKSSNYIKKTGAFVLGVKYRLR
jgi:hypothetical protein